jgi:methyl-accepting chemotaxis protein
VTVIVTIIQSGFAALASPLSLLQIAIYLAMAALSAFIEASLISIMIAEPRKTLEIYAITDDKQTVEISLTKRLIFTNVGFAAFIMLIMIYVNMSAAIRSSIYDDYLERIIHNEITEEEAELEYRQEGRARPPRSPGGDHLPAERKKRREILQQALSENILLFFVLFLIANVLQLLTARETVRQIKNVSAKLKEMLAGSGDLTSASRSRSNDEVGHLVSDLNGFMDSLQRTFIDVQKTSRMALESASSLSKEIAETSSASEELASSVTQVAKNAGNSLTQVETTAKNLSEVFLALDH